MTWEWVVLILGLTWAIVAVAFIAAWNAREERKPHTIAEILGGKSE